MHLVTGGSVAFAGYDSSDATPCIFLPAASFTVNKAGACEICGSPAFAISCGRRYIRKRVGNAHLVPWATLMRWRRDATAFSALIDPLPAGGLNQCEPKGIHLDLP